MFNRKLEKENFRLKVENETLKIKLKRLGSNVEKLYDNLHDPDRHAFWKSVADGIDAEAARKWAFERLNRRLLDLVNITPDNAQAFYINQGAIAELNNFLNIHNLMAAYLKEDMPAKEEEKETESISDQHS